MYDVLILVHVIAFVWNVVFVLVADVYGALWWFGYRKILPSTLMVRLHQFVWLGLAISIVTGIALFYDVRSYLTTVPAFYVKVDFVCVLLLNSFVIDRHLKVVTTRSKDLVTRTERTKLLTSAIVSLGSWIGVIVAASQLGV